MVVFYESISSDYCQNGVMIIIEIVCVINQMLLDSARARFIAGSLGSQVKHVQQGCCIS
jgi:hypothetical protein